MRRGEEGQGRLGVHRVREQEALAEVATQLPQRLPLLVVLDALGDHLERERRAQADDGGGQAVQLRRGALLQEGAVHLEDVDREAAEVAQRGVPVPKSSSASATPSSLSAHRRWTARSASSMSTDSVISS